MTQKQFKWKYESNNRLIDFICKNKLEYFLIIGNEILTLPGHRTIKQKIKNKFKPNITKKEIHFIRNYIFNLYNNEDIPFQCLLKRKRQLTRFNNLYSILESVVISIVSSFIIFYLYETNILVNFENGCSSFYNFFKTKITELSFLDFFHSQN